jgi:MFS family permease
MLSIRKMRAPGLVQRSPIYYGWVVWAVAALGTVATSPGQSYTVALFFDFFINDFGLDRSAASGLYGLGTLIASLSLTWVGRQIDRHGNRRMTPIISVLFALVLVGFSFIAGPLGLLLGFIAIRGLGQGALGLTTSTVVAQWFQQRRGQVMSLTMVVMALFQAAYVPWLQGLLETLDWRQVWVILGLGVAATILPLGWLLMRDRPEDYGMQPDGQPVNTSETTPINTSADDWTLREAMGTAIFWIFLIGRLLMSAWGTGLVIHQVSLFGALGHDATVVAETYSAFALLTAGSALLFGFMVDRFRPGMIVALQMGFMMAAMLLAMVMTAGWLLLLYALSFGLAMGSGSVFEGAVWPNLFGRRYLGEIRGFTTTALVAGSAVGPIIFGLSYDYLDSYQPVLWAGIIWAAAAGVLALLARKPQR